MRSFVSFILAMSLCVLSYAGNGGSMFFMHETSAVPDTGRMVDWK